MDIQVDNIFCNLFISSSPNFLKTPDTISLGSSRHGLGQGQVSPMSRTSFDPWPSAQENAVEHFTWDQVLKRFHLPTINFQGIRSVFKGGITILRCSMYISDLYCDLWKTSSCFICNFILIFFGGGSCNNNSHETSRQHHKTGNSSTPNPCRLKNACCRPLISL